MSAVDSVMQTSITMHMEMIAAISNCGAPKWNGVGKPTRPASLIASKSVMFIGIATRVPATRPSRIAICWRKPRSTFRRTSTISRVRPAIPMFFMEP